MRAQRQLTRTDGRISGTIRSFSSSPSLLRKWIGCSWIAAHESDNLDRFGGFEYGYQQGVLGQSLVMYRFTNNFPSVVASSSATGWLTSVLQLGGILGSVSAGVFGEVFSRKYTMFSACCWVVLGSYLYCGASYHKPQLLYAGRFFTGLGVGTFSGVG